MLHGETEQDIIELARPLFLDVPGARSVALLIHGFSGSPYQMRDLGTFLRAQGIAASLLRLPGHGSRLEYFRKTRLEDWLGAIHDEVEQLSAQYPNVFLVGRSLGGTLALLETRAHPEHIRGVICLSTPAPHWFHTAQSFFLPLILPFKKTIKKPWAKPEENHERIQQGRYLELPLESVRELFRTFRAVGDGRLRSLHKPVLLVQGLRDAEVKPASATWYEQQLGDNVKDIVLVPEASHAAASIHEHPDVQKHIVAFIRSLQSDP